MANRSRQFERLNRMRKCVLIVAILIIMLGAVIIFFTVLQHKKSGVSTRPLPEGMLKYNQTVKNLNEGWDNIELGDTYRRAGEYDRAIEAYKRAYEVDSRNGLLSGKLLIETYEKVGQYDEALHIVDDIFLHQHLAPIGVERFEAIRTRLLAAKSQSLQNQSSQSP